MSRTEIDRMSVLQDLAASRIKVTEAATLMGLGRRQVFRLAKAYGYSWSERWRLDGSSP
jgi:transcriptional regulator with GAF, ATPase, and Fis domain